MHDFFLIHLHQHNLSPDFCTRSLLQEKIEMETEALIKPF